MITKSRALDALRHQTHLAEMYKLEPQRMDSLIDMALSCENAVYRWEDYDLLKKFISRFVGQDAKHSELRTSAHYEVVLAFIDWLLPEEEAAS